MTLGHSYFEDLYRLDGDPWGFRTRWYETRKRQLTLASLPDRHYGTVFEPGCSIGLLTAELAARSGRVLAMDISAAALQQAQACPADNVEFRVGSVPADWPPGRFDLVVLSEIGYYMDQDDCHQLADLAVNAARDLVEVHWRHPVEEYPLTGDQVHHIIEGVALAHELARLCSYVDTDFRLTVWSRDRRSVASRTGLVRP
jgi:SAM-dependent methyltransferase